jgi:hypothetical protein
LVGVGICKSIRRERINGGRKVGNVELDVAEHKISKEVSYIRSTGAVSQMVEMTEVSHVEVVEGRKGNAIEVNSLSN